MKITVEKYIVALKTWVKVARRDNTEREEIFRACAALRWKFGKTANREPDVFCEYTQGQYSIDLAKSCLLDRLIYAQEPLRTRPCPQHKGRWSGCAMKQCPHGCNFGSNITGWLPETVSASDVESRAPVFVVAKR